MGGSEAPPAPDPTATSTGQAKANVATAIANTTLGNADVYSPLGQSTFKQIGTTSMQLPDGTTASVPRYQNDVKLSQGQQTLYDQGLSNQQAQSGVQSQLLGNVRSSLATPIGTPSYAMSYDAGGGIQSGVNLRSDLSSTDFTADRDATTKAVLDRLQPQMDNSDAALSASLANQGITVGSAAWQQAMASQASSKNDLRLGAVQTGNAEQQALFAQRAQAQQQDNAALLGAAQFGNASQAQANGQNAAAAAFGNQARQSQYQSDIAGQNQSMNLLSALQSGSQVAMPQFAGFQGGTVAQTPYADSVYKSAQIDQQNWQTQQQQQAAMMQGLFGLAGKMGGLFSDRRLKRDVTWLGTMPNGLALYSWRYTHDAVTRHVGFMADEVAQVRPEAVALHPSGFLTVDYERAAA